MTKVEITPTYTLWGLNPAYVEGVPIKITGGSLRECRKERSFREQEGGWILGIYWSGKTSAEVAEIFRGLETVA